MYGVIFRPRAGSGIHHHDVVLFMGFFYGVLDLVIVILHRSISMGDASVIDGHRRKHTGIGLNDIPLARLFVRLYDLRPRRDQSHSRTLYYIDFQYAAA